MPLPLLWQRDGEQPREALARAGLHRDVVYRRHPEQQQVEPHRGLLREAI